MAVGANGCTDETIRISREHGAIVGETGERGYGYGCQAAIDGVSAAHPTVEAYIFFAADGANDPRDISKLVAAYDEGSPFVLGQRTRLRANWKTMTPSHVFANRILGGWCGLLTGRFFCDLGPLRLIDRTVFETLALREWTYGWTIEPQILAGRLGIAVREVDVSESPRIAGEQKVSQVNWRRTLRIGGEIFAAGWRSRFRSLAYQCPTPHRTPLRCKDSPNPV